MTYQIVSERRNRRGVRIRQPSDVLPLIQRYSTAAQEHFIVVSLNGVHEVERVRIASIGLVNRTLVHPREVFRMAIVDNASAVIVAHNHPSGNTVPSSDDYAVTKTLREAGELIGITVLDHVIVGPGNGYYSFRENGDL